jgi:hypothetical protein
MKMVCPYCGSTHLRVTPGGSYVSCRVCFMLGIAEEWRTGNVYTSTVINGRAVRVPDTEVKYGPRFGSGVVSGAGA